MEKPRSWKFMYSRIGGMRVLLAAERILPGMAKAPGAFDQDEEIGL
ncbi:MAG: hypothetical protein ABFD08_02930 [Syntrophomonas sp.]